jgi:hypothetical protein
MSRSSKLSRQIAEIMRDSGVVAGDTAPASTICSAPSSARKRPGGSPIRRA